MTIDDLKEDISLMIDEDLLDQYEIYNELASSGVNDQIRLSLLEQEVLKRRLLDEVYSPYFGA